MALKPGQKTPYDICLSDGRSQKDWYLKVVGGVKNIQRAAFSPESFALDIRQEGKRIGNFNEQRSWTGGTGTNRVGDDSAGFYDSQNMWTLADGHALPTLKWYFSTGYRTVNTNLNSTNVDVSWKVLTGASRYISISFSATAQTADYVRLWVRKVGTPGTLTVEICSNSSGDPGAVLQTVTKTAADLSDVISVLLKFDWTGTQALTGSTTYHVKVYGASTDTQKNHWEVGVNEDGSTGKQSSDNSTWAGGGYDLYFRICDADVARRWWFWYGGVDGRYMVDKKDSGNSVVYKWNESTDTWESKTATLATVSGRPIFTGYFHYLPQGTTAIRRAALNFASDAADGTNTADLLVLGYDDTDGNVIWRAKNSTSVKATIARASMPTSGNMTFNTDVDLQVGNVNGMLFWLNNGLWVWQSGSVWQILNDKPRLMDFGLSNTQSSYNGQAVIAHDKFMYWSWLFAIQRIYAGRSEDLGFGWRGPSLPTGRDGPISAFTVYGRWLIYSVDAGDSGTSAVFIWDGFSRHEIFRAWDTGVRIRDLALQPVANARTRLWIDCGSDVVFMELPLNKTNPLDDSGVKYYHEGVLTSATLDMGTASDLPKFIRELVATIKNLNGSGIRVEVDYQTDDDVGTSTWNLNAGAFLNSPEDRIFLGLGDITRFRYRLRMLTDDATTPPDLQGIVPNGYARTEYHWTWNVRVVAGKNGVDAEKLDAWLSEVARFPGRVRMTSKHPWLHDYFVIVAPATGTPDNDSGIYDLSLLEA